MWVWRAPAPGGGMAGLYLCLGGHRPARSRRSSTCGPRGSLGRQHSGWGRQRCSSGRASVGRGRVWLEKRGGLGLSMQPAWPHSARGFPTERWGAVDPGGLSRGILSPAWGHPVCLTWLGVHAAGAAAAGATLLPGAARGVIVAAHPTPRRAGTAGAGAVARALCRGRCSVRPRAQGAGFAPKAPDTGTSPHPHPTHRLVPALVSLVGSRRYLWWGGGRSGPARSRSTSLHRGSCGRRGSTAWGGVGLRSPPPGTRLLCRGQAGWRGASVSAGPGAVLG